MIANFCIQSRQMRLIFAILIGFIVIVLLAQFQYESQTNFSFSAYQNSKNYMILTRSETFLDLVSFYVQPLLNQTSSSEANRSNSVVPRFMKIMPLYDPQTYKRPIEVEWFSYEYYSVNGEPETWSRALDEKEHALFMDLFKMMMTLFGDNALEFMLVDGTLLGSYRHLDFVPWDDDADVLVNFNDKERLIRILNEQKLFDDLTYSNKSDTIKLYHKSSNYAGKYSWRFPFVDIFFFEDNQTHIWRKTNVRSFKFTASKSEIYPLKLRPFGKYWMPVARNTFQFLKSTGMNNFLETCSTSSWSHRHEKKLPLSSTKCSQLKKYYSFVEPVKYDKSSLSNLDVEIQMINIDSRYVIYLFDLESRFVTLRVDL